MYFFCPLILEEEAWKYVWRGNTERKSIFSVFCIYIYTSFQWQKPVTFENENVPVIQILTCNIALNDSRDSITFNFTLLDDFDSFWNIHYPEINKIYETTERCQVVVLQVHTERKTKWKRKTNCLENLICVKLLLLKSQMKRKCYLFTLYFIYANINIK